MHGGPDCRLCLTAVELYNTQLLVTTLPLHALKNMAGASLAFVAAILASCALALPTVNTTTRNDGIHLAIGPTCGKLTTSGNTSDLNAGLWDIHRYKTIVSCSLGEYWCN